MEQLQINQILFVNFEIVFANQCLFYCSIVYFNFNLKIEKFEMKMLFEKIYQVI